MGVHSNMFSPIYQRIAALLGEDSLIKLNNAKVTVVGLGGVGYTAAEVLMRCGVTHLTLIDFDTVNESNINRQLLAVHSTVGLSKTAAAETRLHDINPDAEIRLISGLFSADTADDILGKNEADRQDFVLDAIDTIAHKISLIRECQSRHIPIISSLGAGNRMNPSAVHVCDISETSGCPFAAAIRRKLRDNGKLPKLPVVFSDELPRTIVQPAESEDATRTHHVKSLVGSMATVTIAFGNMMADYVIKEILKD